MLTFCKKMLAWAKLRELWYQKIYFLKLHMRVYLRTKFQVSSIISTCFRQGRWFYPHLISKQTPIKSTQIGLNTSQLVSTVVHMFCGLMTVCLNTPRNFSLSLKTLWRYILLLHCSYAFDSLPSIFSLCFRCIYFHSIFFKIITDAKKNSSP